MDYEEQAKYMVDEIIAYLKKEDLWDANTGFFLDGKHYTSKGTEESKRRYSGVVLMWFEGQLNHALNHGHGDPNYEIYKKIKGIANKHGFDPVFGSHCDFNFYPLVDEA